MSYAIRPDRSKVFLLPQCIDDWVKADHPARFINSFVDSLDLTKLGFKEHAGKTGRPYFAVDLLIKIWIYGYFNRIRSLRDLEKACHNDMGLIWLTGQNVPDHNTLWYFYSKNRKAIKNVYIQSVRLARKLKLVDFVLAAIDGTKIAADVSKRSTLHREDLDRILKNLDKIIEERMNEIEDAGDSSYVLPDELADIEVLKELIEEGLAELDNEETNHLSKTDKESRMMRKGDGHTGMSYNAQIVVDDKIGIITGADVTQEETDHYQLSHMLDETEDTTERLPQNTVADAGYYTFDELEKANRKSNTIVNIPKKRKKGNSAVGEYHQDNFKYNELDDAYICPHGGRLELTGTKKGHRDTKTKVYRCRNYKECPFRYECSKQERGRSIEIHPKKYVLREQRSKQENPDNKQLLRRRQGVVEPVFGYIKHVLGFRRFTVRGLENVKAQWHLIVCTVNLRKIHARYPILAI